jgi:phosphoglycolate phosphatase-like HAD superfamily hydrolase
MELLPSEMARSLPEDLTSFVLPGVFPLLDTLSTRSGTSLSLATGTIQATAEILLERSHLLSYFQVCAFGSECNHRSELVLIALTRAFEYFKLDADQTCVITIGDATSDIEAGRSIGAKTVAVASGSIKRSELEEISPDLILDDFREYQRASNAILSL